MEPFMLPLVALVKRGVTFYFYMEQWLGESNFHIVIDNLYKSWIPIYVKYINFVISRIPWCNDFL